ncbi:MAG: DUF2272 domain-containing protein [Pseudomonadota bacterium]|nr:DUF2272 domain-containing protein [Pseudomonadota bacterium]
MKLKCAAGLLLMLLSAGALASDQCPMLRSRQADPDVATRIAAVACDEHLEWYRPFIDVDGHLASSTVVEAENRDLRSGAGPVWLRVAAYWRDSRLLQQMGRYQGASDCDYASAAGGSSAQACRSFVVDQPWSAAFISWTMQRAGVPGFLSSASHFDYVRAARKNSQGSPYLFLDPQTTVPATGDMLCYVRTGRVHGHAGLVEAIDGGANGLNMHCDIVVAANAGGDSKAYLIGGNVQQAVTMRVINLNATGRFWNLPMRSQGDAPCSPDAPAACNFNRQDWAVLLKLKPQAQLALMPPARMLPPPRASSSPTQCCVRCVLGAVPEIPRCPVRGMPVVPASSPLDGD